MSASLYHLWPASFRQLLARAEGPTGGLHYALSDQRHRVSRLPHYLMLSLPLGQIPHVWEHHYKTILTRFTWNGALDILMRGMTVWADEAGRNAIQLRMESTDFAEGELSIVYVREGVRLYVMSFTLAPGAAMGRNEASVALLTRVQGEPDRLAEIKAAAGELDGAAPPYALIAAVEGVCEALGVTLLIGCGAHDHVRYLPKHAASFTRNYDDFFSGLGAEQDRLGRYLLPLPLQGRPLSQIKHGHRLRTRARRRVRELIAAEARDAIAERLRASEYADAADLRVTETG